MNDLAKTLNSENANAQRIGPMLVARGKLSARDLSAIASAQTQYGLRFGDAAVKLGLAKRADVDAVLAEQFSYTAPPPTSSKLDRRLSVLFQPDSIQAEALRSVRSELLMRYFQPHPQRSMALVASDNAEEIALTAANLAISFAQLGHRTLLIDTNLRNSQLNPLFGMHAHAPGLADRLAGRQTLAPIPITEVPSLWLMPAGTRAPNPQELLASNHYRDYLNQSQQLFDVVLINTPPMDSNRDAQLVAVHSGAALLVTHINRTRTRVLADICQRLRDLGVRLVGTALYR
ncbi:MAG TPA: polysaccharide biosynthesis tyrosine autokinase [Cellvibrio sp.]|nr:polysaccharide biosynthesis tyrosine autokinase [Cellvibrio sp.]